VTGLRWVPAGIDVNQASAARVYDCHLGGWHNFPADRWVAQRAAEGRPELPATVRANRAFLRRAVQYLCAAGVRQFLDLGSGIPTAGHVHEIAHAVDPQARVVYVDVDPVAVAHGDAMLAGIDTAAIVRADLRDVPLVLAAPPVRRLLDFTQPVGVLMVSVLHLLPDADDPAGVVARYRDAVPTGSHLVLSSPWSSRARTRPAAAPAAAAQRAIDTDGRLHTREDIAALFAGWDLVEPRITQIGKWRPDANDVVTADRERVADLGGVARKP
jgi:S-adenosyl methyltransferase